MENRLTGGLALPVLRQVYHARKDEMPDGWSNPVWRSGSMTVYTFTSDLRELFRQIREFEGGPGGNEHINSLKRIDMEIGRIGGFLHLTYNF